MSSTPALIVTPLSSVSCGSSFCRQGGALWATVVVKVTVQLVHGEPARLVTPLGLVRHDVPGGPGGSLAQASETAPHVPNAGVLLTGHAHAPQERAVPSMAVRLGVARERPLVDKTLHVFGARSLSEPSAIMPFQKMPLVYERAFGGAGVWTNPVGTGGPGSRAQPNIVDPKDPRRAAGFGPIAGRWMPRRALLNGAEPAVVEQVVFEPPTGFDWRYFQAAPADQQTDLFRGDEWIVLDGMHPTLPRVQTRLPQLTAQARRVSAASGAPEQSVELRADMLVIDADALLASLIWRGRFQVESVEALRWIRVHAGVELPGRAIEWPRAGARATGPMAPGAMPAATPAAAKVGYSSETREIDVAALFGGRMPFDESRESALPPPASQAPKAKSFSTGTEVVDVRALFGEATPFSTLAPTTELTALVVGERPEPTATVAEMPAFDPSALPFAAASQWSPPVESVATPAARKPAPQWTGTTDVDLAAVLRSATPYGVAATARAQAPIAVSVPELPRVGPASSAPAASSFTVPPAFVAPLVVSAPAAVTAAPALLAPAAVFAAPVLSTAPAMAVAPAVMAPATILAAPALLVTPPAVAVAPISPVPVVVAARESVPAFLDSATPAASAPMPPAPTAPMSMGSAPSADSTTLRETVLERLRTGQSLHGLRLAGADLQDVDFKGSNLAGLDLQKAKLSRAKLVDVRLIDARLVGADLSGADLSGADLGRADLSRAELAGARFDHAILVGARLCDARGKAACFNGARMAQADLQGAALQEASFNEIDAPESVWDKAALDGARFLGAKLRGASFQRATFDKTSFAEAELVSANLQRATGTATDLRSARMEAADLRQASLPNAVLDDADLREVSATKADFSGARFFRTDLSSANLRVAKLNGADFTHTKLDGADFRDAEIQGIKIDPAAARLAKIRLPR